MNDEPNALPIVAPELVDFLGQFILNLNEVIRRQQAYMDALEAKP